MKLLRYNYKQKNNWTCGPACMRVILDFFGIRKDLKKLIKELKTEKDEGTNNKAFIGLLKKYHLKLTVKENADLDDMKRYLKDNLVVTGFWLPYYHESHYAIVTRVTKGRIFFHDTWFGANHSYELSYFLKNWWDEESKRWMVAIKKGYRTPRQ